MKSSYIYKGPRSFYKKHDVYKTTYIDWQIGSFNYSMNTYSHYQDSVFSSYGEK